MTALFPAAAKIVPPGAPRTFYDLFAQKKWWPSAGGWIKVKEMTPDHRRNAAALLLRNADRYVAEVEWSSYSYLHDAPDDVLGMIEEKNDARRRDPQKWMRGTRLYRRLTKDIKKADLRVDDNR